jgi:hypothetical protein
MTMKELAEKEQNIMRLDLAVMPVEERVQQGPPMKQEPVLNTQKIAC